MEEQSYYSSSQKNQIQDDHFNFLIPFFLLIQDIQPLIKTMCHEISFFMKQRIISN